jgi:serpin B
LSILAVVSFALTGCTAGVSAGAPFVMSGAPAKARTGVEPSDQFVGAVNDFGIDLLEASAKDATGNIVVSPASVHAALSMTVNGATDETAKQMRDVLRTSSISPAEANSQWAALLGGLAERSSDQTLTIANALFARKGIAFKAPFISADRDSFGAEVSAFDFKNDDVAGAINGWVSRNTRGMITKIVDRVPPNAILYLANAVYFKGDWATPFKHELTQKATFFPRTDGSSVAVDMMHATGFIPYAETPALQATKLAYAGNDSAYYIFLPKQGVGLDTAARSLGGTGFSELRQALSSRGTTEVVLGLPKLDSDFATDLAKPLAEMGMPRAFDPFAAQFSAMADLDEPIYISRVLHKTRIKVNELGTEAAAATVVEMTAGAAMPTHQPVSMICNRPYLFAIVDEKSGAMLFLGATKDPSAR